MLAEKAQFKFYVSLIDLYHNRYMSPESFYLSIIITGAIGDSYIDILFF